MRKGIGDLAAGILIVAEIGNNHEGDVERAGRMIEEAARCGAGAVKFQTFQTEHYVGYSDAERFKRLKGFELPYECLPSLAEAAHRRGLLFLSTPFDLESAARLDPIVDVFKVASGDNDFIPLLERLAASAKPIIISTGSSDVATVDRAVSVIRRVRQGRPEGDDIALLHCVSAYPVPPEEANLLSIPFLAQRYPGLPIGYSDHVLGIEACLAAAALGARILEKHFTLDKNLSDYRDHRLSADPAEMAELVRRIRIVEAMRGEAVKRIQPCEEPLRRSLRRSVAAASDLPQGHRLGAGDITWVRPGGGLPPGEEWKVLGRRLARPVRFGEMILPGDVTQ